MTRIKLKEKIAQPNSSNPSLFLNMIQNPNVDSLFQEKNLEQNRN